MIVIKYRDPKPYAEQIYEGFVRLIDSGALAVSDRLPGIKELSYSLTVNPIVVSKGLKTLESNGYVKYNEAEEAYYVVKRGIPEDIVKTAILDGVEDLQHESGVEMHSVDEMLSAYDVIAEKLMENGISEDALIERIRALKETRE